MKYNLEKTVLTSLVVGLLATAGCTLAPKYGRGAMPVPEKVPTVTGTDTQFGDKTYIEAAEALKLNWDEYFDDPRLTALIDIALMNNRDLRTASLNVEYYRKLYHIQAEALLPTINGTLSPTGKRLPADLSSTGSRTTTETYDASLGAASWEIDFFGRIRSLKDKAMYEYMATEQAQRGAYIALIASVAQAYYTYAVAHEELELSEKTLRAHQATYEMVSKRYKARLVSELDVAQAESQIASAKRSVATYTQAVALGKNNIELLLGAPVEDTMLPKNLSEVSPAKPIAPEIPSSVLLSRPDVLAAELQLQAANANIGAARAAYFPRISLTGAIGSASSELSGLFKSGSGYWSYAPQLVLPIFDMRTWSSHKASKVQKEMMLSQYEASIQSAFKDVADVLAENGTVDKQLGAQADYVNALTRTFSISSSRYKQGIDNYMVVLDAQRSLFSAELGMVALRGTKLFYSVKLYSVLGGGWVGKEATEETSQADVSVSPEPVEAKT